MSLNHSTKVVEPLRDLLGEVLLRLEALEGKVGISSTHSSTVPPHHQHQQQHTNALSSGSNHTKGKEKFIRSLSYHNTSNLLIFQSPSP